MPFRSCLPPRPAPQPYGTRRHRGDDLGQHRSLPVPRELGWRAEDRQQANPACGDRALWLSLELRYAPRRRWWRYPHRRDHRRWDTYPRELPRASAGLGQRRTLTHLLGLGYLWSSGCTRHRARRRGEATQDGRRRSDGSTLRYAVDVWLPAPLPCRAIRCPFSTSCRGLHGIYHTRGRTRCRCGSCDDTRHPELQRRHRRHRNDDEDAPCPHARTPS